jgi:hypothetical protein
MLRFESYLRLVVHPLRLGASGRVNGNLIVGESADPLIFAEGEKWRILRSVVFEHDPRRAFGGLRRVLTRTGDYLWVCPDHYVKDDRDPPRIGAL